jgi:hypothetical protein
MIWEEKSYMTCGSLMTTVVLIHPAQVGLAEAQQIKAARKPNNSLAHLTQWEVQSTKKTSPMGEGWLSLLKWLPPLKLSKDRLFWDTYHRTCGPRDLTVLHRRDVCLEIEPYTTRSKDVLIILTPLNWATTLIPNDTSDPGGVGRSTIN